MQKLNAKNTKNENIQEILLNKSKEKITKEIKLRH